MVRLVLELADFHYVKCLDGGVTTVALLSLGACDGNDESGEDGYTNEYYQSTSSRLNNTEHAINLAKFYFLSEINLHFSTNFCLLNFP